MDATLFAALIALVALLGWATRRYLVPWIQEHVPTDRLARARAIARAIVLAAEVLGAQLGWDGPIKKAEAMLRARATDFKEALGLTDAQWDDLIEKAWEELLKTDKRLFAADPAALATTTSGGSTGAASTTGGTLYVGGPPDPGEAPTAAPGPEPVLPLSPGAGATPPDEGAGS